MIGSLLSMKFIGEKSWIASIIFWAVMLVISYLGLSMIATAIQVPFLTLILGFIIFIALAHYWYKLKWIHSIIVYIVGFAIDAMIILLIFVALGWSGFSYIGIGGIV